MEIKNIKPEEFISDNYELIDKASNIASFVFRQFGWTWGDYSESPNQIQIASQYKELIRMCIRDNTHMVSTGRLVIEISLSKRKGDIPALSLYLDLG
jgi:hypothetical protein